MESSKLKVLWMIAERGDRSFWTRIGVGHVNRDGSINLVMEAMPLGSAKMQLRDYTPRDAEDDNKTGGAGREPGTGAARDNGNGNGNGRGRAADPHEARP